MLVGYTEELLVISLLFGLLLLCYITASHICKLSQLFTAVLKSFMINIFIGIDNKI